MEILLWKKEEGESGMAAIYSDRATHFYDVSTY